MRDFIISLLYKIKSIKACLPVWFPPKTVLTEMTGSFVFAIGAPFKFLLWAFRGLFLRLGMITYGPPVEDGPKVP